MVANLGKEEPPAARRGARRLPRREPAALWWVMFAVFAGIALWLGSWRVGLLVLLVWCLYQFILVPTVCRVLKPQGHFCTERVRGRLFACGPDHQQLKTDALWQLIGMRNPFRNPDIEDDSGVVQSPYVSSRLTSADRVLIVLAALGTLTTLVGMIYGFR
ncbi:hypothetical protein BZB76_5655 [Actinomadura pelletieri DSM 43383]|uniref:Uncharacterized protein n=1 Tax=Actinomadura pelletieri DSM 43383 TaxID=1120940 RepID=A0A495QH27_9ACTN|nr:hypothetical protein [Actinomadura pelletieri]RKS71169.1 hypothetical protein BZB76_5655 [Actinomadura pelletieri DSM 43383]